MIYYDKETADAIARGEVAQAALEADHSLMLDAICQYLNEAAVDESQEITPTKTEDELHQDYLNFLGL